MDGYNSDNSLNLAVCPNFRKLFTLFKNDNLDTLKIILNNCQHLESIKINKKEA